MENIREIFKRKKCNICKNRNKNIKKDLCDIRVFQYDDHIYCKCINEDTNNKEEIRM